MNLKKTFYLIFIISSSALGQNNNIVGSWKTFAVDNGEFFFNSKNDSLVLYKEFDYIRNDSLKINQMKMIASQMYFNQKHIFQENGKYLQNLNMMNFNYDYKIDQSKNIILASESEFKDEKNTIKITYNIENNILYLEIPLTEPPVKLWLEK